MRELNKTGYCRGLQCPKILWMDLNMPGEAAEERLPENFVNTGRRIGELARSYFGEHTLVEYCNDLGLMADVTKRLMAEGCQTIAEAAFMTDGLYCAVDILRKNGDGWDMVEVKSSSGVNDLFAEDMAFQYYVLTACGVNVKRVLNMHINSGYVRKGALDLKSLFRIEDLTETVVSRRAAVGENIKSMRSISGLVSEPKIDIDCYCEKPYTCPYIGYCRRNLPEPSVFDIAGMQMKKKYALYREGIVSYEDIIKNPKKVSKKQLRQAESSFYNKPDEYDTEEIGKFLDTLYYPLYHLDFETFQPAVPEYEGCRPYEQIPFQYSLHIEHEDGSLEHREFLAEEGTDPRRKLAESLVRDIPGDVCSLAYNMSFEKGVIKRLAEQFPDLSERLMNIHDNLHDLMIPFQKQYYYSAAMQGSYSIKYVLPALCPDDPELDYHNWEGVHNGAEASETYGSLLSHTEEERAVIRKNMLAYCGLDTYAMVKVLSKLREVCQNK